MLFKFDIRPQVKERARSSSKTNRHYTPQKTVQFEKDVAFLGRMQMKGVKRFEGPLSAEIVFCLKRPKKSKYTYPKKGDCDNFVKNILDSLNGVVYDDDSQIVKIIALKKFSDEDCIYLKVSRFNCENEVDIEGA